MRAGVIVFRCVTCVVVAVSAYVDAGGIIIYLTGASMMMMKIPRLSLSGSGLSKHDQEPRRNYDTREIAVTVTGKEKLMTSF